MTSPRKDDEPNGFAALADDISDLLRRIENGRAKLKEAKPILDALQMAIKRLDAANLKVSEVAALQVPQGNEGHQQWAEEMERHNREKDRSDKDLDECWQASIEATDFINTFRSRLELFTKRLPLTDKGRRFARAIASLQVNRIDAWQEIGDDPRAVHPDLETLELRLKEILRCAGLNRQFHVASDEPELSERDERIERTVNHAPASGRGPKPAAEDAPPNEEERKSLYADYQKACKAAGVKMTERILAKLANPSWQTRDPIAKWKQIKDRLGDDAKIRAAIAKGPPKV